MTEEIRIVIDKKKETRKGYIVNTAVLFVGLILFGIINSAMQGGSKGSYQLIFVPSVWQCSYLIILAVSLNLVLGFLGQLSLGHCGFMAIGAYTAALVSLAFERAGAFESKETLVYIMIVVLSIVLGGILAALIGLVVGIPALRLKGDYLAIITLGFGMIIVNVINNLPFAGQEGLAQGSAAASLYKTGLGFNSGLKVKYLLLAVIITLLSITVMFMFIRSKFGRTIIAVREDEIAANASGINVSKYKIGTFVLSAFFAGIAGGLYACCNGSLSTSSFAFANGSILNSTFIVVMVVLGGMGSLTGSAAAAVGMFLLNYLIKNVIDVSGAGAFVQNIFNYPMLVYAIVLIIIILFKPKGLLGTREFSIVNFRQFIFGKGRSKAVKAEEKGGARS